MFNFLLKRSLRTKLDFKNPYNKWVIRPNLPWYKKISVILTLGLVLATIGGSYLYLHHFLVNKNSQLLELTDKYKNLKQNYSTLKTTNVKIQRELEIARQSQLEINGNLLQLHQESQNLTEQVDLYKRIMSGNIATESVLIENIQLVPLEQAKNSSEFLLRWVMMQARNKRDLLQGRLEVKISGKQGDNAKTLNYSQIAQDKNSKLTYKFRDFQQFNRKIKLPANFVVQNVTVEMFDNGTMKLAKSKTYEWQNYGRGIHVAKAQV